MKYKYAMHAMMACCWFDSAVKS